MSIVILISSFSAIVGAGGAPLAAIAFWGQGNRTGRKDIREWICPAFAFYGCDFFTGVSVYGTRALADGSFGARDMRRIICPSICWAPCLSSFQWG